MFTIKEISANLNITPQAIYKQKNELLAKGYMVKNQFNQWEITDNGYNYLRDKQINRIKQFTGVESQPVENNTIEEETKSEEKQSMPTQDSTLNLLLNQFKEQITTLQNQVDQERESKEYFKAKFEEKDRLLNEYLNHHFLTAGEQPEIENLRKPEIQTENKQGFLKRLFNK